MAEPSGVNEPSEGDSHEQKHYEFMNKGTKTGILSMKIAFHNFVVFLPDGIFHRVIYIFHDKIGSRIFRHSQETKRTHFLYE